ncbi:LPXTG cell wall anchor domain-containing protein [Altibacter sp. HG106]|uniref:LPXTG cell wall anchor domain-containing protein n=1 Tax=Altibacter sp. HG106 TaxID=3023937 RepID=UPI002350D75B|nr:LPXTG cell wall anchor domain-containing protein [Altibacter sp. HG106]MDC7994876.1 LPXTG cell wall anchor domain-containing protein [Altibacter sp. HG106]
MRLPVSHISLRNFRRFGIIAVLLSFASEGMLAQVESSVDTTLIRIGEEIQYTIEVSADTTDLVLFPEGQSFAPLETIESYKTDTLRQDARYRLVKKYGLTQFDSGAYTIPSQRVFINDIAYPTDSVAVEVRDVAVDTTQQKMFTIKPAVEVKNPPIDWKKWLLWIGLVALILGGIAYLFYRKKKKEAEKEVVLEPYEEAMVSLHSLDQSNWLKEGNSKTYYSQLTEIVKRYLDREVDDRAQESTTDELIFRLQMHKDAGELDLDTATLKKLDAVLKRADLVKFAKFKQLEGQAKADRSTVEEVINETKAAIPEPTEEELRENEAYLEALQKQRKRKRWIYGISGVAGLLLLGGIVYGSIKGFDSLRDIFFSNVTKELAEGRWVRSEYGTPAIIIETPDVLVRQDASLPEGSQAGISNIDMFSFGDFRHFYTSVSTVQFAGQQEFDLDAAVEGSLQELERKGATNLLAKKESFSTEKGITGVKAYGEFNFVTENGKELPIPLAYEILTFSQANGMQQVMIVYPTNETYAEAIKERIINSVELEVLETQTQ